MIIIFTIIFNFFNLSPSRAKLQVNPAKKQAWVIIIEPGSDLFTRFGHSAFVILSPEQKPLVYDFGNFIYDNEFLRDFFQGKAYYFIDKKEFHDFVRGYKNEERTIKLYQLDFQPQKVEALEKKLNSILKSPEKFYHYHHFKKNCATQMRDLISTFTKGEFRAVLAHKSGPTWRRSLEKALGKYTSMTLGLKLILAGQMDQKRTMWDATFMPLHLEKALKNSSVSQGHFGKKRPLVKSKILFYQGKNRTPPTFDFIPIFVAGALLIVLLLPFFWFKNLFLSKFNVLLLFFLQSFFSLVLLFFAYNLEICAWNLNFLSFFPWFLLPPLFASKRSFYQVKTLIYLCLSLSVPLVALLIKPWVVQKTFPFPEIMVVFHLLIIGQWLLKYFFLVKNSSDAASTQASLQTQKNDASPQPAENTEIEKEIENQENPDKTTNLEPQSQLSSEKQRKHSSSGEISTSTPNNENS